MKVHDVSLVMRPDMTLWGTEPGPSLVPLRRIAKGDTANVSIVSFADHTGTHVDPPLHFIEGGAAADQIPVGALVGPCLVIDYTEERHVDDRWLESARIPGGTERILFKTRNSERWRDPTAKVTREFVTINASGARWCVAHGVRLVGIDYLSIEPQGPEKAGYPVHHTLLGAGIVIIEGLDLRGIAGGAYDLVCAPLKIGGADGAPARVFLIER